jgi:hypothetical protein
LAEPVTTKTSLARFTAKNERAAIHELKTRAIDSTDKPANTCGKRWNIELSFIIPHPRNPTFLSYASSECLEIIIYKNQWRSKSDGELSLSQKLSIAGCDNAL